MLCLQAEAPAPPVALAAQAGMWAGTACSSWIGLNRTPLSGWRFQMELNSHAVSGSGRGTGMQRR